MLKSTIRKNIMILKLRFNQAAFIHTISKILKQIERLAIASIDKIERLVSMRQ